MGFAAVWGGVALAHRLAGAAGVSAAAEYERFERQADESDPAQRTSAERDMRDSTIDTRG